MGRGGGGSCEETVGEWWGEGVEEVGEWWGKGSEDGMRRQWERGGGGGGRKM